MKLLRILLVSAVALAFSPFVQAQGPQYTLQTQSIEGLADLAKQFAQNHLPKEIADEFQKKLFLLDPKLVPGIDGKRPFGAYATFAPALMQSIIDKGAPNLEGSSLVVMIPMSNEKDLVDLIGRTGLAVEKQADGSYSIAIPRAPIGVFMRAEKDYMYVSVASDAPLKKPLAANTVLDPKETGIVVLRQHHENFTKEAREMNAKYMKSIQEMMKNIPQANLGLQEMAILNAYFSMAARWNDMIDAGGKLSVGRLGADVKSGELYVEWTIDPKAKSKLAEQFEAMKPTHNAFAGLTHNAVAHGVFTPPLDIPEVRDMLLGLTEKWKESQLKRNLPAEEQKVQDEMIKAVQRTIKSESMDMAVALRGPNAAGLYTFAGAVRLDDPVPTVNALRALWAKEEGKIKGKWDVRKIGSLAVHELSTPMDAQAKKYFGDDAKVLIGVGPKVLCVAIGGDALAVLKQIDEAKEGPAPLLSIEANGRRTAETLKKLDNYEANLKLKEFVTLLGKMERVPIFGVQLEGGKQFKARFSLGIAGIMMLVPVAHAEVKPGGFGK